jgi:hypothetical protein
VRGEATSLYVELEGQTPFPWRGEKGSLLTNKKSECHMDEREGEATVILEFVGQTPVGP